MWRSPSCGVAAPSARRRTPPAPFNAAVKQTAAVPARRFQAAAQCVGALGTSDNRPTFGRNRGVNLGTMPFHSSPAGWRTSDSNATLPTTGALPGAFSLLTVRDVAELLRVSPSLIYQLVESGKIACHRIGRGRGAIRIRLDDLEQFLAVCRSEQHEPAPRFRRPKLKHIKL